MSAVITPHGVCARLLRLQRDGLFALVASPRLLAEMRDVLSRDRFRRYVSVEVAEGFAATVEAESEIRDDPSHAPVVTEDPGDDYLVALAVAANAEVLVSGDSHLTELTDPPVPVLTPREFLERLASS